MSTNIHDILRALPKARREKIQKRAEELVAEEVARQQATRLKAPTKTNVGNARNKPRRFDGPIKSLGY